MRFFKISKNLGALSLAVVASVLLPSSCRPGENNGETDTYIENGQMWAYGRVSLTWVEGPGVLMLERKSADQSMDTNDGTIAQDGSSKFQIYGALFAMSNESNGRRDIAYVDYHASEDKLLAYAWSLEVSPRAGATDRLDVFAALRKPGRSRPGYMKIFLGSASLGKTAQSARIDLDQGLKMSLIGEGVYQGQWALHLPDIKMVSPPNFGGFCSQKVSQMPGQMPSQNPMQKSVCRPLPPQVDLCKGTPTKVGCRPSTPVQSKTPSQAPKEVTGLAQVGPVEDRVYEVQESAPAGGKIVFVSSTITSSGETNAELCSRQFYAVSRTEGEQINTACILKSAPIEVRDGKLTCAVSVEFDSPQTYLEKICNVTGLFSGGSDMPQTVQILQK